MKAEERRERLAQLITPEDDEVIEPEMPAIVPLLPGFATLSHVAFLSSTTIQRKVMQSVALARDGQVPQ